MLQWKTKENAPMENMALNKETGEAVGVHEVDEDVEMTVKKKKSLETRCSTLVFSSVINEIKGIQNVGQYVHPECEEKSRAVERYFDGNVNNLTRENIIKVLRQVAGREEWEDGINDPQDLARIFILFLFNCVLFPTSHLYTPGYVVHYVDELDTINEYAWGKAIHEFLINSLDAHASGKIYIDGCTIGLLTWFFERVPCLAKPLIKPRVPRFLRWKMTHPAVEKCMDILRSLTQTKVIKFYALRDEKRLLQPVDAELDCSDDIPTKIEGRSKLSKRRREENEEKEAMEKKSKKDEVEEIDEVDSEMRTKFRHDIGVQPSSSPKSSMNLERADVDVDLDPPLPPDVDANVELDPSIEFGVDVEPDHPPFMV